MTPPRWHGSPSSSLATRLPLTATIARRCCSGSSTRSKPMTSILARELLGSALAAIEGQMIRVPCFSHGRSMDASETYEHWHPLEWFAKDPQGLFSRVSPLPRTDGASGAQAAGQYARCGGGQARLDLIHLRYMVKHAPDGALAFMTEQKMFGIPFDEYWPRPEIHQPLYEASVHRNLAPDSTQATSVKRNGYRQRRTYHLHPNFSAPLGSRRPWAGCDHRTCCTASTITVLPPAVVRGARDCRSSRLAASAGPSPCRCCSAITTMRAISRIP